jgi:hypothetical protein
MRLFVSLMQWADPKDGCDIVCRVGEWKIEKDLRIIWHVIDNKYYPIANSFRRLNDRPANGVSKFFIKRKWEIK